MWALGPDGGPNLLIDATNNVRDLSIIKDPCQAAFNWVQKEGLLCGAPMWGVRFTLVDATIPTQSPFFSRGRGQTIPTARRVLFAAFLTARPRLMEPIYLTEIHTFTSAMESVQTLIAQRRGRLLPSEDHQEEGRPYVKLRCYLPVREASVFAAALRDTTGL